MRREYNNKKIVWVSLILVLGVSSLLFLRQAAKKELILTTTGQAAREKLTLATTTSTENSGLLDVLLPPFEKNMESRSR